jgi:hypothetical protein
MNQSTIRYVAAALLFGLWAALVLTGHPDPDLIASIKAALFGLGVAHAVLIDPKEAAQQSLAPFRSTTDGVSKQ